MELDLRLSPTGQPICFATTLDVWLKVLRCMQGMCDMREAVTQSTQSEPKRWQADCKRDGGGKAGKGHRGGIERHERSKLSQLFCKTFGCMLVGSEPMLGNTEYCKRHLIARTGSHEAGYVGCSIPLDVIHHAMVRRNRSSVNVSSAYTSHQYRNC